MKNISYEEMKALYLLWLCNPVGAQDEFFESHGWTREGFFDTAVALEEQLAPWKAMSES